MTDFDKIFWGFIFSAIGITIGWILNQLGQWFKTRQEDKKHLKIVLFNLLEVYFILNRSDLDKFITKLTDKVYKKTPKELQTDDFKQMISTLYSQILMDHLKKELLNEIKTVKENYQLSIKTLAGIDPLAAYYLNGRNYVIEIFDTIQNLFINMKDLFPEGHTEIQIGSNKALEVIKPDILKDAISETEKDIKEIAWKINPFVWYKSIKSIKRLKVNTNERLDKEIDKLLDKLDSVIQIQ
jgi:hypothetical protein